MCIKSNLAGIGRVRGFCVADEEIKNAKSSPSTRPKLRESCCNAVTPALVHLTECGLHYEHFGWH
jgi:hypothetical protein